MIQFRFRWNISANDFVSKNFTDFNAAKQAKCEFNLNEMWQHALVSVPSFTFR